MPQAALLLSALLCALTLTPDRADAGCPGSFMIALGPCDRQKFRPRPDGPDPNASPCLPLTLTDTDSADRLEGE